MKILVCEQELAFMKTLVQPMYTGIAPITGSMHIIRCEKSMHSGEITIWGKLSFHIARVYTFSVSV